MERDHRGLVSIDDRESDPDEGMSRQPAVVRRRLWYLALEHPDGMAAAHDGESGESGLLRW